MKNILIFSLSLLTLIITSCNDDDPIPENKPDCNTSIIIDKELYTSTLTNNYSISSIEINEDCITIEIMSSGCDGETWEASLYDSGDVAESYPVQRFIRLLLVNNEECEAEITKSFSFDLTPIKDDTESAILHIEGWDNSLLYD